jgi:hypothetical protein
MVCGDEFSGFATLQFLREFNYFFAVKNETFGGPKHKQTKAFRGRFK